MAAKPRTSARSAVRTAFPTGLAAAMMAGCAGPQSMLDSAGPEASRVIVLWWILLCISGFAFVTVTGILLIASFRKGGERGTTEADRRMGVSAAAGIGVTIALLAVILAATFRYSEAWRPRPNSALTIDVLGKLWWWEITYIGEEGETLFRTANEIHIPTGVPVRFRLRSDNVIHSFWAPSLGGKMDMNPGHTNYLHLEAREPGVYRGQCAEFCGLQHTNMAFLIVAEPREDFERWIAAQREPAREPTDPLAIRGREVYVQSQCAECHTVRGTVEATAPGPDLTHLAGRRTLASGTIPNRKGHLAGWIADPHGIKPGSLMPASSFGSEDFLAVLRYLETLE